MAAEETIRLGKGEGSRTDRASSFIAKPEAISFRTAFDFKDFVSTHMLVGENNEANDIISQSAAIVGQEDDGSMLLVWDAPLNDTIVTHFGIYHSSSPSYRTLYTHDKRIRVSGATIDSTHSLLAFTLYEDLSSPGINYESFVAEINPCNRLLSLNISSPDVRKLQFVQSPSQRKNDQRKTNLLVIIPDNWICLYAFQLNSTHKGWMVNAQPSMEVIVKNVSWYQWLPKQHWLCYARFGSTPAQTKKSGKHQISESSVILHVLSFLNGEQKVLITVALPTPCPHTHYTRATTYYPSPLGFTLPVYELNMKVLHSHEGVWCVCLQHKNGILEPPSSPSQHNSLTSATTKLEYSIYNLHNGHVIDLEVFLSSPSHTGHHIQFMLLGNAVVAYVPNVMLHILNIGVKTDPCHHIILDGGHAPLFPGYREKTNDPDQPVLINATPVSKATSDVSYPLFDVTQQSFYSCRLESSGLLDIFKETSDEELKMSLLHFVIVSLRQYEVAVYMIENVCQSPLTLDAYWLFQEFIIALSFANVPPDCSLFLLRHFPLTMGLTYQGKMYKNEDGSKQVILRCTELPNLVKQLLVQSDQKLVSPTSDLLFDYMRTATDTLGHLCYNAVVSQPSHFKRLSLEDIANQVRMLALSTPAASGGKRTGTVSRSGRGFDIVSSASKSSTFGRSGKFMGKLKDFINSPRLGRHGLSGKGSSSCLPFLLPDEDLEGALLIRTSLFHDRFLQMITSRFGLRSKLSTGAMIGHCETYLKELQASSHILLHIIWKSLKFTNDSHPLRASIHRQPSLEEGILFELLESFYTAHIELGIPTPPGFHTLFVSMGYMCLEPSVFVQYLQNDVFIPTRRFLQMLFGSCDAVDEAFLFEVIACLDYELQEVAFDLWKHPMLRQMLSREPGGTNSNSFSNTGGSHK